MKSRHETSARKLRGGFYTPEPLVQFCISRLRPLLRSKRELRLLEPSAGDGAFVRGIAADRSLMRRTTELLAIEPQELEAEKCRRSLAATPMAGSVIGASAIDWGLADGEPFDAAMGNPPFVRYQFISKRDKAQIARLGKSLNLSFAGVSNLWLPVIVVALSRLRPGGAFSFVVPTELLTGMAAASLRTWLVEGSDDLRIDLFEPGSFPGVLQEVAVLSGRRAKSKASSRRADGAVLTIAEHDADGRERTWRHTIDPAHRNWTRYLLEPRQLAALDAATASPAVVPLGTLARFQVSVVTGANDFFCVSDEERQRHELAAWSRPLLPRIRHASGLVYTTRDQVETIASGARSWLLDFAADADDPLELAGPRRYLQLGTERKLPGRYKCRIRKPWFRVPHIERGSLLLSKRSHRYPRAIVNEAFVYTTDTIYRGDPLPDAAVTPAALSATFHSSLTLLSAELEGRSFGGGVLELVPSEIMRLAVVNAPSAAEWIEPLDAITRSGEEEKLVRATDELLVSSGVLDADVLECLSDARADLMGRRLARNDRVPEIAAPHAADVAA